METRDEAAPSHRTWKTPMKLAFPTAPTAPAARRKSSDERPNQKNDTCLQSVSIHLPLLSPARDPHAVSSARPPSLKGYFESGEGCSHDGVVSPEDSRCRGHAAALLSASASRIQSRKRFELTTVRSTNAESEIGAPVVESPQASEVKPPPGSAPHALHYFARTDDDQFPRHAISLYLLE